MTLSADAKRAILAPLVERLCVSHHWRDHRHVNAPFDARRMNEHLAGSHRYGLCPIAPGSDDARVGLLDLDSHKGEVPFSDMLETAHELARTFARDSHRPALWRSSGGQGIHIILTWAQPQLAYAIRRYLTETLEDHGFRAGTGGVMKGEIEVFPKQDSVPADGFGSMFLLPFSGKSEPL